MGSNSGRSEPVLEIAIIGAGLSGLTSARDLRRAGLESFVVLEARDRAGGRTWNHEIGEGVASEAGGQWIGRGHTAVADLARELGVDTFKSYYKGKTVYLIENQRLEEDIGTGGVAANPDLLERINALSRGVPCAAPWTAQRADELDRLSLADWIAAQDMTDDDEMTFRLTALLTYGAPPEKLGLLHYLTLINSSGCDLARQEAMEGGAQETRLVGGSYVLCAKMVEGLADKIRLSSPVRKIVGWDRDVVEIHTDRGVVCARQVIAALSQSLCTQIEFDPPLPPERRAMQAAWPTVAHMRKVTVVYPRPFWRDAGYNGQVLQIGGPLLWSADNSPPDASVGIITGFVAEGSLPPDKAAAVRVVSDAFVKAYGDQALHPSQYHDMDWAHVDEWTLSCTSPYPPGFLTKWGKLSREPMGRIVWSGTDMAEFAPSSMDGAVRTGHRVALSALATLIQGRASTPMGADAANRR